MLFIFDLFGFRSPGALRAIKVAFCVHEARPALTKSIGPRINDASEVLTEMTLPSTS
jgi:hypothetical protein